MERWKPDKRLLGCVLGCRLDSPISFVRLNIAVMGMRYHSKYIERRRLTRGRPKVGPSEYMALVGPFDWLINPPALALAEAAPASILFP